ncbi:hypothetical protein N7492_004770 [Penicillium capsulatum]|uniref:Uncharacterized protein n=1 Tax=Penicillium capsulatum TaxID=69766 RepID=A0A9W9IC67_9EURO|nr:hypothetical protein N7492_004770 [Penicillium capsulatum]KAJ6136122.1 hypothetical protein N7512_001282 [Penicillium capsulatum]
MEQFSTWNPRNVYPSSRGLASGFASVGKGAPPEKQLDAEDAYIAKYFHDAKAQQEAGVDRKKGYVVIRNPHDSDSHLSL